MTNTDDNSFLGFQWPSDVKFSNLRASSSKIREALQFWLELRNGSQLPTVSDFDFVKVPQLVSHLTSIDVGPEPDRFRLRYIGSSIAEMTGRNATGKELDEELYPENRENVVRWARHSWKTAQPVLVTSGVAFADRDWTTLESLHLPLRSDEGKVVRIVSCVDPVEPRPELDFSTRRVLHDWRNSRPDSERDTL